MIKRMCVWSLALVLVISLLPMSAFAAVVEAKLTCTKEVHTHTEECYKTHTEEQNVPVCGMEETEGHTHGDDCYAWTYGTTLICGQEEAEAAHTHGEGCYEEITLLVCNTPEHTHSDECQRTCTNTDPDHVHTDECQRACTLEEHTHDDSCYKTSKKLICTQSDLPAHKHTKECYERVQGELLCTLEETPAHTHTEDCYEVREVEVKEVVCGIEEHVHTADCYSNRDKETGKTLEEALQDALMAAGKKGAEDTKVILVLNGQTLNYAANGGNAILVDKGQELTIQDAIGGGGIHGNTSDTSKNIRIIMVTNGTVNLEGGTLSGGKATGGAAILVGDNGKLNMTGGSITGNAVDSYDYKGTHYESSGGAVLVEGGEFTMSGGSITGNTANDGNGGGVVVRGVTDTGKNVGDGKASFTMTGGTIDGNTANNDGGGVYVGKGGTFTMSGGAITGNSTDTKTSKDNEPVGQGGGVAVGAGGSFGLSGGAISGNTAGEGGGVFVDRGDVYPYTPGKFTMTGGAIDGNTAVIGEGGGVYIKGEGEITSGAITNNATYTHEDLGGGGIYIEADGALTLKNAIVTGNIANGLGGGIAACVHGKTLVYALNGAVITGNTALGEGHSLGHKVKDQNGNLTYNGSFVDGYTYWWSAEDVIKNAAQDVFAAGDSFEASFKTPGTPENGQGTAGIIVSNNLPGENGGKANWKGYTYCYVVGEDGKPVTDDNGNYIFEVTEVTEDNNGVVYGNRLVFLSATPGEEAVKEAIKAMQSRVIISGNLSANSHGGGIANNGVLTIGEGTMSGTDSKTPEAEMTKELNSNDANVSIANKTFTFELKDKDGNLVEGGSVTNDETGKAVFSFPPEYFNDVEFPDGVDEVEYVFYVSEKDDGQANVTYDGTQYKVIIRVTRTTETVKLGHENVKLETLSIGEPEILVRVVDENGSESYEAADGIKFTNTYTKPTDPPGGGNTPGGDDPGDTPTPRDPDPSTEVEEPEVPLAERPEEPEKLEKPEDVEIEDPDIPLADIPQTGDIHLGWYGASILSALGLMMMALLGRKKSRES